MKCLPQEHLCPQKRHYKTVRTLDMSAKNAKNTINYEQRTVCDLF